MLSNGKGAQIGRASPQQSSHPHGRSPPPRSRVLKFASFSRNRLFYQVPCHVATEPTLCPRVVELSLFSDPAGTSYLYFLPRFGYQTPLQFFHHQHFTPNVCPWGLRTIPNTRIQLTQNFLVFPF